MQRLQEPAHSDTPAAQLSQWRSACLFCTYMSDVCLPLQCNVLPLLWLPDTYFLILLDQAG